MLGFGTSAAAGRDLTREVCYQGPLIVKKKHRIIIEWFGLEGTLKII